jgi:ankyrin repeat protein
MVKLLPAKGALPDADCDENSPVFIAIAKGHDEIPRTLIESGCDLKKRYVSGENEYTAGDLTVVAKKKALISLIRQRGGLFTMAP